MCECICVRVCVCVCMYVCVCERERERERESSSLHPFTRARLVEKTVWVTLAGTASSSSNFRLSYTHLNQSSLLGYNIFLYNCFIGLRHSSKAPVKIQISFWLKSFHFVLNAIVLCGHWRSDRKLEEEDAVHKYNLRIDRGFCVPERKMMTRMKEAQA